MELNNEMVFVYDHDTQKFNKELRKNTEDVTITNQSKFSNFDLSHELLRGIYELGFTYPSPIQKEAIPIILNGQHLLARAKNGTGKTAAFGIPAVQLVDPVLQHIQVIIIVPSRELAIQTEEVISKLASYCGVKTALAIGGTSVKENLLILSTECHIVIATPGRLRHVVGTSPDIFSRCKLFIVDEADVLLSANFEGSIETILKSIHTKKQILLLSATFPEKTVKKFADEFMPNAGLVNTMECLTLRGVTPFYVYLEEKDKLKCVWYLINQLNINQSIVFVNTVARAELLYNKMISQGYNCACIHSKLNKNKRTQIYNSFKRGDFRHLVSTNLFTRGIDIKTVNVVINFDFPHEVETYIHRIGRSGRFGQIGLSIEFVTEKDKVSFYKTEDYLDLDIEQLPENVEDKLYN